MAKKREKVTNPFAGMGGKLSNEMLYYSYKHLEGMA